MSEKRFDYCIVNTKTYDVYGFYPKEIAEDMLVKAKEHAAKEIKDYDKLIADYPDRTKYWQECKNAYVDALYEIMTYKEFILRRKERLTSAPIREITKEEYIRCFNVMLPLKYCIHNGMEMFCMREMYTGPFTTQYLKSGDKYYAAMVDVTDKDTWIPARLERMKETEPQVDEEEEIYYD